MVSNFYEKEGKEDMLYYGKNTEFSRIFENLSTILTLILIGFIDVGYDLGH